MAAKRPKNNHEEIRVKIEQAKREVMPAVSLEKKEIKMKIVPASPGKTIPKIVPASPISPGRTVPSFVPASPGKTRTASNITQIPPSKSMPSEMPAFASQAQPSEILEVPPGKMVPSIMMTAFENGSSERVDTSHDAGRIVGIDIGPLTGEPATTESGVPKTQTNQTTTRRPRETKQTPTSPKFGSRLTVEQTTSIIEKTEDLMEFFQDHDKKGLTKRTTAKKPRTPSPSPVRQSIGLDHLDNLVRLMEQLSNLKDENSRLKHRCDYLESTKSLLQEKSKLDDENLLLTYQYDSLPRSKKGKTSSTKSSHSEGDSVRLVRPRLPSAEDAKFIEFDLGDSSSDQTPKRPKGTIFKRSFSTGSLEVPSDIMEQSGEDDIGSQVLLADPFDHRKLSSKMSKSPEAKRKSKFSKWAKVKKVLTKQQLSENISSGIKSIKGLGKGAYFRYGSVSGRELAVPSVAESRSVDSGVGSGMDGELQDVRKSTSSNEPPSPTRFIERHIDVPTPQIDDCMGIWLGPPEWIEKEREKEQQLLKQSGAMLSESPKSEPGDIGSPRSVTGFEEEGEKFLQVPIPRRQSSPLLLDEQDEDEDYEAHITHTSSYREHDVKETEESFHKIDKGEKKHKTAWGKMKNIIHTGTRKDSVKKKRKGRESDSFGFEEVSETDFEVSDEMRYVHEGYLEGPVSRSTPKTSPVVFRQKHRDKSVSPPNKGQDQTGKTSMSGGSIDVSALMGGITDEFTRKLQEWEELKGKRASGHYKESSEFSESVSYESAGAVSPEFLKKLEEWEKVKSLKGIPVAEKKPESQIEGEGESSSDEIEEVSTPPERQRQSINVDEIQRKLTDSFSRKMEEWERQKYRRQNSQTSEIKDVTQKSSFKDRPKSKKTKEEKEKEKIEKLREREFLRVEREQQKLEKERMRIEKERLKALEREAKIEKMKGRLSQPDMDTKLKNPVLSPLTEYKVTADFARKLHEWEVMKGKEMSTAMYLEAQKRSLQFSMEYQNATNMLSKNGHQELTTSTTDTDDQQQMRKTSSESDDMFLLDEPEPEKVPSQPLKKGEKPAPLMLIPYFESPEPSPSAPISDTSSLDDQTTETMESMTQANIMSLEKANNQLLYELREREFEYNSLQEEVRDLNERLMTFRQEHALELEMYKKQMVEGVPPKQVITLETRHMTQTLTHLEEKIGELKKFGEQLAMSMEGAAVGKFQTVEGEESINNRLVDLLDKMRLLLQQATRSGENTLEEVSKKSSALHNFEKLYSQAMQLQVQMNNLRLSQLERNKEIMMMKRQLLLQEANNLILQADVTRREADLLYYKEYAQKRIPIKRWNTYSGKEDRANIPDQDTTQKQSIFQRVQRLRSIRPLTSSTTDSDSDVPSKSSPARRESPRVRKRESPKLRKKDSPKSLRRESPSSRRKESPALKWRESPSLRRKESPGTKKKELALIQPRSASDLYALEKSIERREEHVRTDSLKRLSGIRESAEVQFSTVTLPTAKVTLPKDISPHEMNGVPRRSRDKSDSPPPSSQGDTPSNDKNIVKEKVRSDVKFPELLIPEWKKVPSEDRKTHLQRMPSVERDDVFESDGEDIIVSSKQSVQTSEVVSSKKVKIQEMAKLAVDVSFDSSETSEDTLKYLSPDASPAPQIEPPTFPSEIKVTHKSPFDNETVSDPGQSRPNSMVRVAIEPPRTPVLLRRPPLGQSASRFQSAKLNIPVIPLRRIKPAQELLEDSQKYRSGHSIYLTRILKRYPMKIECRSRSLEDRQNADRGTIKAGYVKAMVKQLSREGTPDSRKSSPKHQQSLDEQMLQDSDANKQEFVQHIVHKLSSPSGPSSEKSSTARTDLTNNGQVRTLREAFTNGSGGSLSEKGSDSNGHFVSVVIKSHGSQDIIACSHSSSSASTITFSQLSTRTEPGMNTGMESSKVTYSSMPLLSLEGADGMRERAATTSNGSGGATPAQTSSYSPSDSPSQRHRIHVAVSMSPGRSRRVIDPSMSPARLRRLMDPASPGRRRRLVDPSPIEQLVEEPFEASVAVAQSEAVPSSIEHVPRRSPKSKHKDQSEMGTIGVLCRQSMTFDLGVSLQGGSGAEGGGAGAEPGSQTLPIRHSTSSTTSTSSQSEVEAIPGSSKEKKKSRNKFLDSAFIQKSKKFFRVSKENRCPSLECCGSDREQVITV